MWPLEYLEQHVNTTTVCLALVVVLLTLSWSKLFVKHRYPPGPIPLPFIGNSYMTFSTHKGKYRYEHWAKKYGSVVSYVDLGRYAVELYGYDTIYEAFVKNGDNFTDRDTMLMSAVSLKPGLVFGDNWRELRRQALTVLRDHGMGKAGIERNIGEELEHLLDAISSMKGTQDSKAYKLIVGKAVSNVTNRIVFGHRLEYDDSEIESLMLFEAFFIKSLLASLLPFYRYWPWDPLRLAELQHHFDRAMSYFRSEIKLHKESLDIDHPKDYIDSFLAEGIKTGNPIFTDEDDFLSTIMQLFVAGSDTTSTSLTWALLFLINYPLAQERVYNEIMLNIGTRPVSASDKESMHFTQAFLHEALRMGSVGGGTLPHLCTADTVIQGHKIPKGTKVFANLYSTFHDEDVYPDSYSFKPDRFLDDSGAFIKPTGKQMLPFGIGKRACLGENLARTELFMFFVSIVQRFKVGRIAELQVSEQGVDVLTHNPKLFQFNIEQRS